MSNFFSSLPNTQKWNRKIVVTLPSQNMFNLINLQRTNVILKVSKMNKNRKVVISRTQQKTKTKKQIGAYCLILIIYTKYLHILQLALSVVPPVYHMHTQQLCHSSLHIKPQHQLVSVASFPQWRASLSACSSFPSCPSVPGESLAPELCRHQ